MPIDHCCCCPVEAGGFPNDAKPPDVLIPNPNALGPLAGFPNTDCPAMGCDACGVSALFPASPNLKENGPGAAAAAGVTAGAALPNENGDLVAFPEAGVAEGAKEPNVLVSFVASADFVGAPNTFVAPPPPNTLALAPVLVAEPKTGDGIP